MKAKMKKNEMEFHARHMMTALLTIIAGRGNVMLKNLLGAELKKL